MVIKDKVDTPWVSMDGLELFLVHPSCMRGILQIYRMLLAGHYMMDAGMASGNTNWQKLFDVFFLMKLMHMKDFIVV